MYVTTDDQMGVKELVHDTLEVIAQDALSRPDRFKAQGERATKIIRYLVDRPGVFPHGNLCG